MEIVITGYANRTLNSFPTSANPYRRDDGELVVHVDTAHELFDVVRAIGANCIIKPAGMDDRTDGTNRYDELEVCDGYRE